MIPNQVKEAYARYIEDNGTPAYIDATHHWRDAKTRDERLEAELYAKEQFLKEHGYLWSGKTCATIVVAVALSLVLMLCVHCTTQ